MTQSFEARRLAQDEIASRIKASAQPPAKGVGNADVIPGYEALNFAQRRQAQDQIAARRSR